jgi:hypothetical protein
MCTILLPLAGEGADRRMRVDQNAHFHHKKSSEKCKKDLFLFPIKEYNKFF